MNCILSIILHIGRVAFCIRKGLVGPSRVLKRLTKAGFSLRRPWVDDVDLDDLDLLVPEKCFVQNQAGEVRYCETPELVQIDGEIGLRMYEVTLRSIMKKKRLAIVVIRRDLPVVQLLTEIASIEFSEMAKSKNIHQINPDWFMENEENNKEEEDSDEDNF